ncbi:uncharacterized protein LOC111612482 isoform X2 [Centruroides sculpturatus]|uniref:uncharacterized protein LOC111612482 isoform X2 n=1 Tax=Centruroides sculpturatus TaxID=218467 RepID=UPI000C6CF8D8|nr:uncharacterized protein LOC111612482 isoform X2 [Centruroides sculpturatus]
MPGRGRTQGSKKGMSCSEDLGDRTGFSQSQEMDTESEREILEGEVMENRNKIERQIESDDVEKLRLQIRLAEIESKNKEMDVRKSEIELERDRLRNDSRASNNSELGGNLDSLARKIRWALPKMPDKEAEVPSWFRAVEVVLQTYDVPEELQGQLVLTVLSEKCKTALSRLTANEIRDYETLKQFVLDELKLSAAEYLKEFTSSEKGSRETWPQFAARMEDLYRYYLNSRGVDSFERLMKLVVSDHLKTKLDADTRRYVLLQEGKGWFPPGEIARYAEKHAEAVGNGEFRCKSERDKRTAFGTGGVSANHGEPERRESKMKCYICDQTGHFKRDCPQRRVKDEILRSRAARVVTTLDETDKSDDKLVARVRIGKDTISGNLPASVNENLLLSYQGRKFSAIVDTGVEITVMKKALIPDYISRTGGKTKLVGAFGQQVSATLVTVPISLKGWLGRKRNYYDTVEITCALTDELSCAMDALFSAADYCALKEAKRTGRNKRKKRNKKVIGERVNKGDSPNPKVDKRGNKKKYCRACSSRQVLTPFQQNDRTLHSAKLARWASESRKYNVKIRRRKRKKRTNTDALYRPEVRDNSESPDQAN